MPIKRSFIEHLHSPRIPAESAKWQYTLGLGGLSFFFFLLLVITGILLMFSYSPDVDTANFSIKQLIYNRTYGGVVRNMHYWAGQFMVVAVMLHLVRIVIRGAYFGQRKLNWWIGLILLVLTLLLDFSGYVLRWDQNSYWALVAGTNLMQTIPLLGKPAYNIIVGGQTVNSGTLLRFYVWHIFALPMLIFILMITHFWRIRKDGGISEKKL